MIAHRQKLIKMADASDLGWRVVNEYVSNPLASDSDDEKRIYKAEARASRKLKADKTKRRRPRTMPYGRPTVKATAEQTTNMVTPQPNRRPPGLCFACGKPGHWRGAPECTASASNNKISTKISFNLSDKSARGESIGKSSAGSVYEQIIDKGSCKASDQDNYDFCQIKPIVLKEQGSESPVGRLKLCKSKWQEATDSKYILDIVEHGYKLPLKQLPDSIILKNNKSARENMSFVQEEIQILLAKGVVSKSDKVPYIVNPLTVAYNRNGKPRLVLDCRHINKFLHLFKVKFEDIKVAEYIFKQNSFLFTYDLQGAYHHIDIFSEHRQYLGFSVSEKNRTVYYTFNSLPFGIRTAGHIFTKMLKVVVSFLRARGHKVIMFLDDGIGGHQDLSLAVKSSDYTRQTLGKFGFLLADEKCNWEPSLKVVWLGHLLDMQNNKLFITEERIKRLQIKINSVLYQLRTNSKMLVHVKVLASVTGQIISLQSVLGNKVRLRTRELFNCINARASWNAPVLVSKLAISELEYWNTNVVSLNLKGKSLQCLQICLYNIYTDASATGYGGYIEAFRETSMHMERANKPEVSFETYHETHEVHSSPEVEMTIANAEQYHSLFSEKNDLFGSSFLMNDSESYICSSEMGSLAKMPSEKGTEVIGEWTLLEKCKSSTWRETEAVSRVIQSNVDILKDSSVKVFSDNKNVKSVLLNGSRKTDIQGSVLALHDVCEKENITLSPEWIPREGNELADYLSRCQDCDSWQISIKVFNKLNSILGPYTIDRFASHLNSKCKRFNSRWWVPGTEAVDAFSQFWGQDENWLVPPPRLVSMCIDKMIAERANGTLIVPMWKSSAFWCSLVNSDGNFKNCIKQVINLSRHDIVVPGTDKIGLFAKNPLSFDMLALKVLV